MTPRELFTYYFKMRYNKVKNPNISEDPKVAVEDMI